MTRPRTQGLEVRRWLGEIVQRGKTYRAGAIITQAMAQGFKERTIRAEARKMGIKTRYINLGRGGALWQWKLPDERKPGSGVA